jgi:hypothetical protein
MEIVQDQNGGPQQPTDKQQPVNVVTGSNSSAQGTNPPASPLSVGLSFLLPPASSRTLPLAIANLGDTDLDWKADNGGEEWLKLDRDSGHIMAHEVQTLYVTANSKSLNLGDNHKATVTLTPQGQGMSPAQIAVELQISLSANDDGGPHIAIVDPLPRPGGPKLADLQSGKNTRSWQITNPALNGEVEWTINSGDVDWVTELVPSSGTLQGGEQKTIEVTIDTTSTEPGKYRTDLVLTFTFTDPNKKDREPSSVRVPLAITVPKA